MYLATTEKYFLLSTSVNWITLNFFESVGRMCIPLIIMISGMFMLDTSRQYSYSKIFLKIRRLVLCILVYSLLYDLYHMLAERTDWRQFWNAFFAGGNYHLNFLFSLTALYVVTPPLKQWLEKAQKKDLGYVLLILIIRMTVLPTIQYCVATDGAVSRILSYITKFLPVQMCEYLLYYLLGHYLTKYAPVEGNIRRLGLLSLILFLLEIALSVFIPQIGSIGYYEMNALLMSGFVFLVFSRNVSPKRFSPKKATCIAALSKWSFSAYLVHEFCNLLIVDRISPWIVASPIVAVPVITIIVVICSFAVGGILNQIPIVNKYLT